MIASKDSIEPHSSEQLPNSKRVYLPGQIHADVQVPVREIELSPTKSYTGAVSANDPVRVYDCSGPWGDPTFAGKSDEGLPALRAPRPVRGSSTNALPSRPTLPGQSARNR